LARPTGERNPERRELLGVTRFYAIATQVAAQAVRSGHGKFAQELRELVDQMKARAKAIWRAPG
jgi:hypothetical protein